MLCSCGCAIASLYAMQVPDRPRETSPDHVKRLAWLLACVFAGLIIAIIGDSLSGSSVWYVAIPAVIAVGWLFLANPTECEPPPHKQAKGTSGNETAL